LESMRSTKIVLSWALFGLVLCSVPARGGVEAYEAMGIEKGKVINGTQTTAQVLPGDDKQLVCLVAYLSGKKEKADAIKLRLAVLDESAEKYKLIWEQDFSAKYGGNVGEGNLELLDLDRDGQAEIVVTFDLFSDPLIRQRFGEVIVWDEDRFNTAWSGPFEYDATKAVRDVPVERRDHFVRELDLINTLRTRGVTLFFNKTMIAVAGERLVEPKVVEETFPLRKRLNF
jgi:hypothetical protein